MLRNPSATLRLLVVIIGTASTLCSGALLVPNTASFFSTAAGVGAPFFNNHHQYHSQDSLGQYAYGYSGGLSSKTETKTLDGVTRGSYSYVDANGLLQTVEYTADALNGFRAAATNLPKAPIDARLAPLPVEETAEVAAARAEHMAAYEAVILRNEQHPQEQQQSEQPESDAEQPDEQQQTIIPATPAFRPRIVTPTPDAFLAPNVFGYAAPAPAAGSFSYSYQMPGGYMYAAYPSMAYPAAALRPAPVHYAFSALAPSQFAVRHYQLQPALVQPEPAKTAPMEPMAKPMFLRGAVEQRPFVVTDTVAVRAEHFVEAQHKAAKAAFAAAKPKTAEQKK